MNKFNFKVNVTPNGMERYISFTVDNKVIFIDIMLFMNSSLDKLIKNLNDLKYLNKVFNEEQLELVKQKGIYPYEYMNNFKRFKENCLPDKDCFFNSIKDCGITDEEYFRAIDIWKFFNIKNLGEYHDLYLKTGVLFLCNVFEKFIDICLKDYGLDPCHYFSICRLS